VRSILYAKQVFDNRGFDVRSGALPVSAALAALD